jgi:hypothetical protein
VENGPKGRRRALLAGGLPAALVLIGPATASAAAWSAPETILRAPQRLVTNQYGPQVGARPDGTLIALFPVDSATARGEAIAMSSTRPPRALRWSVPQRLEQALGLFDPRLVIGAGGDVAASWTETGSHFSQPVRVAVMSRSARTFAPVEAAPAGSGVLQARAGIDGQANVTSIWSQGLSGLLVADRGPSGTWGTPIVIDRYALNPELAVASSGAAVAAWTGSATGGIVVRAAVRPPGGTWGAATTLSSPFCTQGAPRVAVDAAGDAAVIWSQGACGGSAAVMAAVLPAGGAWEAPQRLARSSPPGVPLIAIAGSGRVVAVWRELRHVPGRLITLHAASRAGPAESWAERTALAAPRFGAAAPGQPALAVNARADAAVVWAQGGSIRAILRPRGGPWGAIEVAAPAGSRRRAPAVAIDPRGRVTVAWRSDAGTGADRISAFEGSRRMQAPPGPGGD